MDGLRGPLIVEDPNNPYASEIDGELVLTLSDFYHDEVATLIPEYIEVNISPFDGSEPVPQTALMNDTTTLQTAVQAGKTYFLRIINMSGFAQFYFHIDQHNFTIIETDGIYMHAQPAGDLYLANGMSPCP
jgi:iron transport multicopper oxidase